MGLLLCKKKKIRIKKKKKQEDKQTIFPYSKEGMKRNQELIGQEFHDVIDKELGEAIKYCGIYSGHGMKGKAASLIVKDEVRRSLLKMKKEIFKIGNKKEVERIFKIIFAQIQKKLSKNSNQFEMSGCCVVSCLIIENICYFINLGDSRAVIGAKQSNQKLVLQMTSEHLPDRGDELKRIESSNGFLSNKINDRSAQGKTRIFSTLNEEIPGLAISRSLGDLNGHSIGVIYEPEVSYKELNYNEDKFILLASDGIWDVISSSEAVGFIFEKEKLEKEKIVEEFVNECRTRWEKLNEYKAKMLEFKSKEIEDLNKTKIIKGSYIDDITAVICFLNEY